MTTLQSVRPVRVSRRPSASTIAIVGALHLTVIYGLYVGLTHHWVPLVPEKPIDTKIIKDVPTHPLPPLPTIDVRMTHVEVPPDVPPRIDYDKGESHGITTVIGPATDPNPPAHQPVVIAAQGIGSTHTIPAYPAIDVRLNHTGNVLLQLAIDERGYVTAANVEKSSGYDTLDNAAVAWVIAHWRYQPATKDGKPMPSTTTALVNFRLTGG